MPALDRGSASRQSRALSPSHSGSCTDPRHRPILAFLAELPTGPATVRRRILAIDAAHRSAGYPPPSASPAFDALLRPPRPARFDPALVAAALAVIPVGGWPAGIVGRRDAALVALVCTAGLTRRQIQALRTPPSSQGDDQRPGTVGESAPPAVAATEDTGTCPACALTRWQWVATTTAAAGWRTVRNDLADLGEILAGAETTHHCTQPLEPGSTGDDRWGRYPSRRVDDDRPQPLVCAIDRHGTPQTAYPLSVRSITTIVATRLANATRTDRTSPSGPSFTAAAAARPWNEDDHARALAERKAGTDRLAGYQDALDAADAYAYAEAILARLDANWPAPPTTRQSPPDDREAPRLASHFAIAATGTGGAASLRVLPTASGHGT